MKEHNKYYWEQKAQRAEQARKHTDDFANRYADEIAECIQNSVVYTKSVPAPEKVKDGCITYKVVPLDSVSAIFECGNERTAVLNFASYKNPGGHFIGGSRAQEECLCHESFLYNVLKEMPDYYAWNSTRLNNGLYTNRAIFSPDVVFEHNRKAKKCDVITCASPNWSVACNHVSQNANTDALKSRIRFILEIAKQHQVDTLILGAFGCGVFKQDPAEVARLFHELSDELYGGVDINIVFAVIPALPGQPDNLSAFKYEFSGN